MEDRRNCADTPSNDVSTGQERRETSQEEENLARVLDEEDLTSAEPSPEAGSPKRQKLPSLVTKKKTMFRKEKKEEEENDDLQVSPESMRAHFAEPNSKSGTSSETKPKTEVVSEAQKKVEDADPHSSLTWGDFFMYLAFAVSLRSKDEKSRVGCVLISPDTLQVLSTGYNGYTRGISTEEAAKHKKDFIVHAEANAIILKGHMSLKGAYAFVTLFPCLPCAVKLIQARIKRIYFLSLRNNGSTSKSWKLLTRAGVELIPYPREKNGTLRKFGEVFTSRISKVHDCILAYLQTKEDNPQYKALINELTTDELADIVSQGQKEDHRVPKTIAPLDLWKQWFMFIAMTASIKSTKPEKPEGCLLVDSNELKMCGMSYRGFPRGIESDDPELKEFIQETEVSAVTNALSMKFKEGSQYYCFATHFPDNDEAKYIAQARVTKLFFICPAYNEPYIDKHALKIFEEAEIRVVPMTGLGVDWINKVIRKISETLNRLDKKERETNNQLFTWPTPDTFSGIWKKEDALLTLSYPLILGGKAGLKPLG